MLPLTLRGPHFAVIHSPHSDHETPQPYAVVASFLQGLISQGIITTAHAAYLLDIYPCEIPSDLSLITGIELSWEYPHGIWNSKEGPAPLNTTQTNLFLRSVLDYLHHAKQVIGEAQERKLHETFDQRVAEAVETRFAVTQASLLEQNQGQEEKLTVSQHRVEVRHAQNEENTVSQRSGEMHLEEKEDFTPGHEPKVIPDAIIIATVAQQSAVLHLAEMADVTPGYAPKVTPDENIIATVEQQSAEH